MSPKEQREQMRLMREVRADSLEVMGFEGREDSAQAQQLLGQAQLGATAAGLELADFLVDDAGNAYLRDVGQIQRRLNQSKSRWYKPWKWGTDTKVQTTTLAGQIRMAGFTPDQTEEGERTISQQYHQPLRQVAGDLNPEQVDRYTNALIAMEKVFGEDAQTARETVFTIGEHNGWTAKAIDQYMRNLSRRFGAE